MKYWTDELFGVQKPIIAMCHLGSLPGDPYYDQKGGMKDVIEWARKDLNALQNGGVDAVMFSNEFSREVFSGVYASDFGLWNPNCGEIVRH